MVPVKKQFRTTAVLLFIILFCLWGVFYVRGMNWDERGTPLITSPVKQGLDEAFNRLDSPGLMGEFTFQNSFDKSKGPKVELVFSGMKDSELIAELLSILKENEINAAFYVTGTESSAYSISLSLIANSGYPVGIAYDGSASIAGKTAAKLAISDFVRTSASIQLLTGVQPSAVLALATPDEDLLAAAHASSLSTVIVPTRTVLLSSVTSLPNAERLLSELPRGSILCLQLDGLTRSGVDYVKQLCAALSQTDFSKQANSLLSSNYEPAQEQMRVYTTERAAAFTFSGLGNEEELNGVLSSLDSVKAIATFFVSANDLAQYAPQVRAILDKGHGLGITAQSEGKASAEALLVELMQVQETLRSEYGYIKPLPVRPDFGGYTDSLRQACGAGGFTLLSAITNAVKPEDAREADPLVVLEKRFPKKMGGLQRGEIVHFQMKQFHYSNSMLGELAKLIATQRNIYELKPAIDILNNQDYTYTYPLNKESILPEVRDAIYPGQLTEDPFAAIQSHYIGISWVDSTAMMPGFTSSEVSKLDKKGLIPNSQNMVFLTFDDWGTDNTITALLDVLRKHNAIATFFVRTQYVSLNPNLLRAIALEGHSIASHTHNHLVLSNDTGTGTMFTDLTPAQGGELAQDLVTSYQELQSIVGDISIHGRPALTRLFRPPTLSVGKIGLTAVLDSGFTYSISGSRTLNDYKAVDAAKLANTLKSNTKSGAVLIMHMSDNSIYTAEALDMYLTEMAKLTGAKAYRFASLAEVLK